MEIKKDLKKELKELYAASAKKCAFVTAPEMNFIMADGAGDPNNNPSFEEAVEALFAVSYTIKFAVKKTGGGDFTVMPLEGLWWADGHFDIKKKGQLALDGHDYATATCDGANIQ